MALSLQDIRGQVLCDDYILNYYSVDSSFYKIRPKCVVIPKNVSDVIQCVKFARKSKISVTARGGGTGLVGSALNSGIIMDLKNFDKIKLAKNYVTVQPGVRKGKLDQVLAKKGKFLGPNPSVGPYCTIGGMIGTNASGTRSLKYGSMIDNLLAVTVVTGQGKLVSLTPKTRLAKSVSKLAKSVTNYPNVSKNSCGYRLDRVKDPKNIHKIIAGSEGTLGIVVSAKLRIYNIPKKKTLLVVGYNSPKLALHNCQKIIQLEPSAVEYIDDYTMRNFGKKFPKSIKCLLFVEFDGNIQYSVKQFRKISDGTILYKTAKNDTISKWWALRNASLHYSLKNLLAKQTTSHIIEDATLPVEKLEQILPVLSKLKRKFNPVFVMYGHAGNGNLHVRVSVSKNKDNVDKIAKEFFAEIIRLGGTITGEHGDGIARTKFVKMQYGSKTYSLFSKLKHEFDPDHILNPGKIIS
ncbi:MAG: FAD-binding oxidoreductase [Thaumarchaeota archaeon]|nr:FAD-binding oxidoreductase [Nitrososphaerota archaeon]